jgi:hypothetical protein
MSVLDIQDLNLILLIQGGTRIGMQSGLDLPLTREIESRERAPKKCRFDTRALMNWLP